MSPTSISGTNGTEVDDTAYPHSPLPLVTLTSDNVVTLRGPVTTSSVSDTIQRMISVTQTHNEVNLVLSTPGGSVVDGYQLVQVIDALAKQGKTVNCIADVAISMGFVIFQSCPNRYVRPSSILMQHQMSFGISGPIEHVNNYVKFVNGMERDLTERQAKRLGLSEEEFRDRIRSDWWAFGYDILRNDMADEMRLVTCDRDLLEKTEDITFDTFFGPVTLEMSKCPLIAKPLKVRFGGEEVDAKVASKIVREFLPNVSRVRPHRFNPDPPKPEKTPAKN